MELQFINWNTNFFWEMFSMFSTFVYILTLIYSNSPLTLKYLSMKLGYFLFKKCFIYELLSFDYKYI